MTFSGAFPGPFRGLSGRYLARVFPGRHLNTIGVGCAIPRLRLPAWQKSRSKPADGAVARQL
jgi:hypothetical protein